MCSLPLDGRVSGEVAGTGVSIGFDDDEDDRGEEEDLREGDVEVRPEVGLEGAR